MEIAENITLVAAIGWVVWEFFSLVLGGINLYFVFPPRITWLPIFAISIVVVIAFHQSALHLIWLWALSFIVGVALTLIPWVQLTIARIFLFLSAIDVLTELELEREGYDEEDEFFPAEDTTRSKLAAMQPLFKGVKKEKPHGFG